MNRYLSWRRERAAQRTVEQQAAEAARLQPEDGDRRIIGDVVYPWRNEVERRKIEKLKKEIEKRLDDV